MPIVVEEITEAIKALNKKKVPGSDGLPIEIYQVYCSKLDPFLLQLFEEIVHDQEMHLSTRRGILTLIEKIGKDPLKLDNWRPLTLLNSDYKILSKIIAIRLEKVMQKLINKMLYGFLKGRLIAENILNLTKVVHYCNETHTPALLVSFDFQKAFDFIEWTAITVVLRKFNFGEYFINLVKILCTNVYTCALNNGYISNWFKITRSCHQGCCASPCALNNGYISNWFKITRSCHQGCCASPLLFHLVIEVLGPKLLQNPNIRGIEIEGEMNLGTQ